MIRRLLGPALTLALALGSGGPLMARDIWVDGRRGSDGATGDRDAPLRSLAAASDRLRPGDTLHVVGGVYHEALNLSRSGTPGAPIHVRGEGRPLIEAKGDAISITGSYVVLEGFEAHAIDWGSATAVGKHNHHVTVRDNILRDSGCGGLSAQYTDYLTVVRNTAYGNARRSPWQCSGLSLYHPEAADRRPGLHNLFEGNIAFDNQNVVVDEAITHSGGRTTDGNGIIIDDADHTQADTADPPYEGLTLITGNLVFDNGGRGIHVYHSSNVVIARNVAYRDAKDPRLQRPAGELSATFSRRIAFLDNIAVARPGEVGLIDGYGPDADLWRGNLYLSDAGPVIERSRTSIGADNSRADPRFVRPLAAPGGDFHLLADSPARRSGIEFRLDPDGSLKLDPSRPTASGLPDAALLGALDTRPTGRTP